MNLAARLLSGPRADLEPAGQERVVLRSPTATLTAAALAARAASVAGAIAAAVEPDARVAILADNDEHFVVAYLGILSAGRVAVPLNPQSPDSDLARKLDAVGASLLVTGPGRDGVAVPVPVTPIEALETLDAAPITPVARETDDLAVLLFTSGTAGMPKAAMLTHGCLAANLDQVQSTPGLALRADDIGLAVLPFFHVFGLNVVLGLALASGGCIVCVPHFDPAATLATIRDERVTVVAGVPAMYRAWLDLADAPADAFAGVRLAVSGAAAIGRETLAEMQQRFGVEVHEGYGLTEASPIVTTSAVDAAVRPGSIGPPLPGVEIRLVDRDGDDALDGDPGEIWVRGANVFAGYWQDPETSERVLAGGWLHTGDIAVADHDGWLTLVDRSKDLIIVSGFNVYPGEVETALVEHESVVDAAVIGESDPRSGEKVVAFVVAAPGASPTPTILTAHLRRRLARYKIPQRFEVVDELPHTFAGKVLRRELREAARPAAVQKPA